MRGADLDQLPVATLIGTLDHSMNRPSNHGGLAESGSSEDIHEIEDGPTAEELLAQGYQTGFDEGVAAAEAAIRETMVGSVEALDDAVRRLAVERQAWAQTGPAEALTLALQIAELIVMSEVAHSDDPGRDAIVRCFTELEPGERAVIRLHPDDVAGLGPVDDLLIDRSFEVVGDPSVGRGDAVAVTGNGSIDARLASAIERVRQELLP
jgi:flagellar assembly protein FliH